MDSMSGRWMEMVIPWVVILTEAPPLSSMSPSRDRPSVVLMTPGLATRMPLSATSNTTPTQHHRSIEEPLADESREHRKSGRRKRQEKVRKTPRMFYNFIQG